MKGLGQLLTFVSGSILWIFFVGILMDWIGVFIGFILGMLFSPGVAIFPLVYWFIEGVWPPTAYFILYGLGWLGVILTFAGARLTGEI